MIFIVVLTSLVCTYTIEVVVATIAKMVKFFLDDNKLTLTIQSGGSLITSHKPTYQKLWQRTCREYIYIYICPPGAIHEVFFWPDCQLHISYLTFAFMPANLNNVAIMWIITVIPKDVD